MLHFNWQRQQIEPYTVILDAGVCTAEKSMFVLSR